MREERETTNRRGPTYFATRLVGGLLAGLTLCLAAYFLWTPGDVELSPGKHWYPVEVEIWDPPFNKKRNRTPGSYEALDRAQKPWRLCVSIPHLKDPYWRGVNYGLVKEAERLGVRIRIVEASGYEHLEIQRRQIEECMASQADGLIVSSIHEDGLNDLVAHFRSQGTPVIDLINGMSSTAITARAAVDFFDMGFVTAQYIRKLHGQATKPARVAWFPGPAGATWAMAGNKGFRAALRDSPVEIVASANGDTGRIVQMRLVEKALDQSQDLDYVVGTTVTANAAIELLRRRGLLDKIRVLAYYYGPGVHRHIQRGQIVAAPTDLQTIQARIAVDLLVRVLENRPYHKHVAPRVVLVDRYNVDSIDPTFSLAPLGFRPVFSIHDWGS